jgi:signal peptide peptidase SppA
MKYHQIIAALMEEPLLITPAAHASLVKLFEEHRTLDAAEFRAKREGVDFCGREVELEQMEIVDGIAHIPIGGPIGKGLGKFEKGAGAVDVADVMEDLDAAEEDANVKAIILDIDSPGGMVSGTPELADRVAACNKPIYAFTSGMMCSAAYWVGCACDGIFATKSADLGSIGVYVPYLDQSKRYENAGLKMEVISSGKYKGAGVPGTSLNADHREFLQERVDDIAKMFYGHVQRNRAEATADDMQGQVFKAEAALAKGLIDEVVREKGDVVEFLVG